MQIATDRASSIQYGIQNILNNDYSSLRFDTWLLNSLKSNTVVFFLLLFFVRARARAETPEVSFVDDTRRQRRTDDIFRPGPSTGSPIDYKMFEELRAL